MTAEEERGEEPYLIEVHEEGEDARACSHGETCRRDCAWRRRAARVCPAESRRPCFGRGAAGRTGPARTAPTVMRPPASVPGRARGALLLGGARDLEVLAVVVRRAWGVVINSELWRTLEVRHRRAFIATYPIHVRRAGQVDMATNPS